MSDDTQRGRGLDPHRIDFSLEASSFGTRGDPRETLVRKQEELLDGVESQLACALRAADEVVMRLEFVQVKMHAASSVVAPDGTWAPFDTTRMAEVIKAARELRGRVPSMPPRDGVPRKVGGGR